MEFEERIRQARLDLPQMSAQQTAERQREEAQREAQTRQEQTRHAETLELAVRVSRVLLERGFATNAQFLEHEALSEYAHRETSMGYRRVARHILGPRLHGFVTDHTVNAWDMRSNKWFLGVNGALAQGSPMYHHDQRWDRTRTKLKHDHGLKVKHKGVIIPTAIVAEGSPPSPQDYEQIAQGLANLMVLSETH